VRGFDREEKKKEKKKKRGWCFLAVIRVKAEV
jgi:hypothetical protein